MHDAGGVINLRDALADRRRTHHHHAYSWTGAIFPSEEARRDPGQRTPPMRVMSWHLKPREMERGIYAKAGQCVTWLSLQFATYRPEYGVEPLAEEQRAAMAVVAGRNYHMGWRTTSGDFVSVALIACPRTGHACPSDLETNAEA